MPTDQNYQRQLYVKIRSLAREMRKHQTPAETYFWSFVRDRRFHGLKFTRQHIIPCPIDGTFTKYYIADFYCHAHRFVVEIDGEIHRFQWEEDLLRTEQLHRWKYVVVRIDNDLILSNWKHVADTLWKYLH